MTTADSRVPDSEDLLSRLRDIEEQPLETQAPEFARVHDTLQARLEGSDSVSHD